MTYMYPFARGVGWISQRYGTNPSNGINPRRGHTGDDWAVPEGTPIYAAADGFIELSDWPSADYSKSNYWLTAAAGDALVLNCGEGKPTFIYGHNSDTMPPVGTWVKKGDIISLSGNSGLSSGPHSHVEVVLDNFNLLDGIYGRTDPSSLFDEYVDDLPKIQLLSTINHVEHEVEMKLLVRLNGTNEIWLSDYMTRRHISDPKEFDEIQWYKDNNFPIQLFDNGKVQNVDSLKPFGVAIS